MNWRETWVLKPEQVTPTYLQALRDREGLVNDQPFRNYPAGTVRFEWAGEPKPHAEGLEIIFRFEVVPEGGRPRGSFGPLEIGD